MADKVQHEWRLEVAKLGKMCKVYCDGTQLMNVQAANLSLHAGKLSTLHLTFAEYGPLTKPFVENPVFHQGDTVIANGMPAQVTEESIEVKGTLIPGPDPIESFIRLAMIDDQTAVLRKYYRETTTGRILCKYGLTCDGDWILIEEGAEAPEECRITPGY